VTPAGQDGSSPLDTARRDELRGRSVRSGFVQLGAQMGQLVVMVASGMVLARLLTPADFGLLAMVTAITGLGYKIQHFGLPQAAVQHDEFSEEQAAALFWRTIELTAVGALGMALSAPLMVRFYEEPRLALIVLVFALAFAVRGLTAVHESVLMRRLRFGVLAAANLTAWTVGAAVGIALAWAGFGYRALVVQALVFAGVHTAMIWWRVEWRPGPRPPWSGEGGMASLLRYGSNLTGYRVLEYIARNMDRVLVGVVQGPQSLGFYDAAYRWSSYPMMQIATPLANVALAGLARVRHDPDAYRRSCRSGFLPLFSVLLPALVFFVVEAERTIFLLLGDQWGPAIPLFRILCVAGIGYSVTQVTKWLFLVEGKTGRQVRWGFFYLPVMALCIVSGSPWGARGVAIGFAVGTWLTMPTAVWAALRDSTLRQRDLYAVALRPATAAVVAAAATLLLDVVRPGAIVGVGGAQTLVRQLMVFGVVFLGAWLSIPGGRDRLREVVELLRSALPGSPRRV